MNFISKRVKLVTVPNLQRRGDAYAEKTYILQKLQDIRNLLQERGHYLLQSEL